MLCQGHFLKKSHHLCSVLASVCSAHLVAVHHEVVCGDERFENYYPAVTGCALHQRVCQVGDADVQLIGAVDQVWRTQSRGGKKSMCECAAMTMSNPISRCEQMQQPHVIRYLKIIRPYRVELTLWSQFAATMNAVVTISPLNMPQSI